VLSLSRQGVSPGQIACPYAALHVLSQLVQGQGVGGRLCCFGRQGRQQPGRFAYLCGQVQAFGLFSGLRLF